MKYKCMVKDVEEIFQRKLLTKGVSPFPSAMIVFMIPPSWATDTSMGSLLAMVDGSLR